MGLDDLTEGELYHVAFLLEDEGYRFYEAIAASAGDLMVRNEVGFLRDEEARHRSYFRSRLEVEPEGDRAARARSFVRRELVEPLSEYYDGDRIQNPGDALRFGAVLEQKSIEFYTELQRLVGEEAALERIAEILGEERRHLKRIHQILVD
jgi:rubrerythrin